MAVGWVFELCCSNVGGKCGTRDWFNVYCFCPIPNALPWLRWLVTSLSLWTHWFHPKSVQVRFVVDGVALLQVSFQVLVLSLVSTVPPLLHTHSFIRHQLCIMFHSKCFYFSLVSIIPPLLHSHLSLMLYSISNWQHY